jgi:thermostable 8-oxoguanine DNA glycosylase
VYNEIFLKSTTPSKLDYEDIVKKITEKAKSSGVKEELIKELNSVGYEFNNAPPRVIFENRRKKLIMLGGVEIFYDTKPKLIQRLSRLAVLDHKLKTNHFTN